MDYSAVFNSISTTLISDACDHLGIECKWLSRYLQPINRNKFWGYADTVQWSASRKKANIKSPRGSTWSEVAGFIKGISPVSSPRVYVAGCNQISDEYVLLGGLSLTYIEKCGYTGVVANGRIRDFEEVSALGFPIWFSSFGLMDSQGCMVVSHRGQGCIVNGYRVEQDEIVFGDGNGVVALASETAPQLLDRALQVEAMESGILAKVKNGEPLYELIEAGGHI